MYESVAFDPAEFQSALLAFVNIKNWVHLHFTKKCIRIDASIDKLAGFMELLFPVSTIKADKDYCIGIELPLLLKIMQMCTEEDTTRIQFKDDTATTFTIMIIRNGLQCKTFELNTVNLEEEQMEMCINQLAYKHVLQLPATTWINTCNAYADLHHNIIIEYEKNDLRIITKSTIGTGCTTFRRERTDPEYLWNTYDVKRLQLFSTTKPLNRNITLAWHNKKVLRLQYNIGSNGYLRYHLAPQANES